DANAQFRLGEKYLTGDGVPTNPQQSAHFFGLAADQGMVAAQRKLAQAYETGKGVSADIEEARRLYRLAAEQGDRESINALNRIGWQ
ncbi:MAG: sel1 repeat family protein, partial [Rhodocyclaceae bacterium]|nr:sel1 repeat family protein [Rhodocyclaceae bacterium]